MFVISISHKNAKAGFRERLALPQDKADALQAACRDAGIPETVYLSTCNRCELYGNGDHETAMGLLAGAAGVDGSELKSHVLVRQGDAAIRHLFHVACGLDSMVLGEDEILGQLRRAYLHAKEGGYTKSYFHKVFQAALGTAKKVKTDTRLSKSSVSIATLAAAQCHKFCQGRKKVLLIGASGDTGSKVMKNLISYGDCEIIATVRKHHRLLEGVQAVPYAERYRYIDGADIIISATSSPHYTVTRARMEESGVGPKPRLFVDLAVPSDIDACVLEMPGAGLLKIDDFEQIAEQNLEIKENERHAAEGILAEGVDELRKEMAFQRFYPEFSRIKAYLPEGMEQFIYAYRKAADADAFLSFLGVLSKMYGWRK